MKISRFELVMVHLNHGLSVQFCIFSICSVFSLENKLVGKVSNFQAFVNVLALAPEMAINIDKMAGLMTRNGLSDHELNEHRGQSSPDLVRPETI